MSEATDYAEFDACGPLPEGVTVLEASAGTGKTYTIAALAARFLAAGIPLEQLLLITFTRMATGELRDRVRERLVGCEERLAEFLETGRLPGPDPLVELLCEGPREEVERRHARFGRAVSNFEAATIATTHGFCQEVLAELGVVGDLEPETVFVEDVSDLLEEVLDDLYVRRFQKHGGARFERAEALRIARAAVFNPDAELEPRDEPKHSRAAMRYRLADAVRRELEARKRQLGIMTYDDLLTRLNRTLDPASGAAAAAAAQRLRTRYRVVLVDEFQDTDPVQYQILRRAFAADGVTLVLIADPKQAIYAFRGADVFAYLTAAQDAARRATLRVNQRSDQPLLDAYDALLAGVRLGHPDIVYRQVRASAEHQQARLLGAPVAAALRFRVARRDEPTVEQTRAGYAAAPATRRHIAADLAADVVRLLSSAAQVAGDSGVLTAVRPGHVAVLVRTNSSADLIRRELAAAGVPVVINGAGSVFATSAARDWLRLLDALDRPSSAALARRAALTPFIGWDAERMAGAGEAEWDSLHRHLHRWARVLREGGVAELSEAIMIAERLPERLLAETGGERRLTDLRHIAQLLHRASREERLGPTALRGWLSERMLAAERREGEEEQTRRLESDSDAVQVLTIHRSKGLEFPIVYCPFLWDMGPPRDSGEPVLFHDAERGDRRTVDVGLDGRHFQAHQRQQQTEQRGEDLRLMYVALTRARHQAVVWWAGSFYGRESPLTRLLFAVDEHGNVGASWGSTPRDDELEERLEQVAARAPGRISVERSTLGAPAHWSPPLEAAVALGVARFGRGLDLSWRRTSYSDITAGAHEAWVASEPEESGVRDEPESATAAASTAEAGAIEAGSAVQSAAEVASPLDLPLASLPVGTRAGSFVHRVLQLADFAAADLDAELAARVAEQDRAGTLAGDGVAVVAGLRAALETPLGALAGGRRLRDAGRADRLDELEFELPLAGGDEPAGEVSPSALGEALRAHLPAGDPLAAYAARLEDPALRGHVRGFLTGSIDLVLRLPGPRFAVIDYKTNWLAAPGEALRVEHYRREALAAEMARAHYGLQALLYTVALHRYLRWRLAGYDPDEHLAGVLYLFLRGMVGADTPVSGGDPYGVFAWRAPGGLVHALSEVLDGR